MTGEDYEARKDEFRPDWPGYKQSVYPHVEWVRGHNVGWKDGLQAARDAVAALPTTGIWDTDVNRADALAAIDALRGDDA